MDSTGYIQKYILRYKHTHICIIHTCTYKYTYTHIIAIDENRIHDFEGECGLVYGTIGGKEKKEIYKNGGWWEVTDHAKALGMV